MSRKTVVNELHVRPMIKLESGLVDGLRVDQRMKLIRLSGGIVPRVEPKLGKQSTLILKGDPGYKERDKTKSAKRRRARKNRQKAKHQATQTVKPAILDGLDRNKENYAERAIALDRLKFRSYEEYLSSKLWQTIRERVIELKGNQCSLCPKRYECIHHHSYRRDVLSGKNIQPLFPLCHACHEQIEFSDGHKRQMSEVQKIFRKLMQEKHRKT